MRKNQTQASKKSALRQPKFVRFNWRVRVKTPEVFKDGWLVWLRNEKEWVPLLDSPQLVFRGRSSFNVN
jgi:hypothetical protein